MKSFTSNAEWPAAAGVTESTDNHDTREAAEAVCRKLEEEGFGGEGKIFPIRTWVGPKKIIRSTLVFEIPLDRLTGDEQKQWRALFEDLQREITETTPVGMRTTLKVEEVDDTAPMPVDQAQLLVELDALFKRYQSANQAATWGGSYEREEGGRRELKAIVNPMFDTLLKLLWLRNPEVPKI